MERAFDVIVAGAGLAGVLASVRLRTENPNIKIALLERDPFPGGRLRSTAPELSRWSYGLTGISTSLFEFWNQTLKADPEAEDLPRFATGQLASAGILVGGKLTEMPLSELVSARGAKAIGGVAAARDWAQVEKIIESAEAQLKENPHETGKPFAQAWTLPKKSPAAGILETFAAALGIADIWNADVFAFAQRLHVHTRALHAGDWEGAIEALLAHEAIRQSVSFEPLCRVVSVRHEEKLWHVKTEKGDFNAPALIVAQPPWQAVDWLPKSLWPGSVLSVATKSRPTSVVVLSELIRPQAAEPPRRLPDVVLIPSEGVQAIVNRQQEICFQSTLEYEMSLENPTVGKAVKALKRARKKLLMSLTTADTVVTEGDHLALLPVAWAQSAAHGERRWLERLDKHDINSGELAFCGDAYGTSYDGDANLIRSLLAACQAIGSRLRGAQADDRDNHRRRADRERDQGANESAHQ